MSLEVHLVFQLYYTDPTTALATQVNKERHQLPSYRTIRVALSEGFLGLARFHSWIFDHAREWAFIDAHPRQTI